MPHHRSELIPDDFDDLMSGSQTLQHFLANGLLTDAIDELFDDLKVDVCFKKRKPYIFQCFRNVLLREHTLPPEFLQNFLKLIAQRIEHDTVSPQRKRPSKPYTRPPIASKILGKDRRGVYRTSRGKSRSPHVSSFIDMPKTFGYGALQPPQTTVRKLLKKEEWPREKIALGLAHFRADRRAPWRDTWGDPPRHGPSRYHSKHFRDEL